MSLTLSQGNMGVYSFIQQTQQLHDESAVDHCAIIRLQFSTSVDIHQYLVPRLFGRKRQDTIESLTPHLSRTLSPIKRIKLEYLYL